MNDIGILLYGSTFVVALFAMTMVTLVILVMANQAPEVIVAAIRALVEIWRGVRKK